MRTSPLNRLCVKGNLVRSSAFSDVFRAVVNLDGETRTVDIEKFRVPTNRKRRETFWPDESDSQRDYRCRHLVSDLKQAGSLPGILQKDNSITNRIRLSFPNYLVQDAETDPDGKVNAYLVTPVMTRFLSDPKYFKNRYEIRFSDFLKVFFNILTAVSYMNRAGWCIGALDMDTVCTATPDATGQPPELVGTNRVVLTGFMYAGKTGEIRPAPAVIPFNYAPELLEGKPLTEKTDIYSVAAVILTMLNGTYASARPSLEKRPGDICPEQLSDALFAALDSNSEDISLKGTLRKLIRRYEQEELRDFTFKIDTRPRDYWSEDLEDWKPGESPEPELMEIEEAETGEAPEEIDLCGTDTAQADTTTKINSEENEMEEEKTILDDEIFEVDDFEPMEEDPGEAATEKKTLRSMSFPDAIRSVFTRYVKFSGRARRKEYWSFTALQYGVLILLGRLTTLGAEREIPVLTAAFGLAAGIFFLATLIPSLAVLWRRLHDTGKSGAYCFMSFLPLIGWILVFIRLVIDSDPGENRFGPNPKEAAPGEETA